MSESLKESCDAFIGLGSNQAGSLGNPADYIGAAIRRIDEHDSLELLRLSSLYKSAPWGKTDQADFINAVAMVRCHVAAEDVLKALLGIEAALGRQRPEQWGPRHIDLDLLTYGDCTAQSEILSLPHPQMHRRAFVLRPLLELDPEFEIPGRGRASDWLERIADHQAVEILKRD